MTTEVVTHTSTIDIMAYTFACPDCSQRDQEHKYWKQRHGAKRAAIALSTVDDTDTFDEPEEDEDASREACFACEEAYEQLSTSDKEEKKQRGAQHWKTYQAIPLIDYWNWLSQQPKKQESTGDYSYVDVVLRRHEDPQK